MGGDTRIGLGLGSKLDVKRKTKHQRCGYEQIKMRPRSTS